MRNESSNDQPIPSAKPPLRSVRQAFGKFSQGREFGQIAAKTESEFESLPSLKSKLDELLAVEQFNVSGFARRELGLKLGEAVRLSEAVTNAAFDWKLPHSLEDAHRSLYSLYADRVWRAPAEPRPEWAQLALGKVRANLESGFRHYLADRRSFKRLIPDSTEPAEWIKALALGSHPRDDERWGKFARDAVTLDQLKEVVAQRSLFFLREPDPWVYAIPTLEGKPKAGLIDLLLDEYGWGKLERMHSSVYAVLLGALDLPSTTDHFEPVTSWQYLATLNYQWMCALTPEYSRRLLGTIYLTEATSPDAMRNYLEAWERLGVFDPQVTEFYDLHVSADENHRDVALHEVVAPVCVAEAAAAAEVALGVFDARTLEAEFADHLVDSFTAGRSSLGSAENVDNASATMHGTAALGGIR